MDQIIFYLFIGFEFHVDRSKSASTTIELVDKHLAVQKVNKLLEQGTNKINIFQIFFLK